MQIDTSRSVIYRNTLDFKKIQKQAKVKLVTKIKEHNKFYFGTLVLASYCYCGDNASNSNTDFFQNTGHWLQRKQQHDHRVQRSISPPPNGRQGSSPHLDWWPTYLNFHQNFTPLSVFLKYYSRYCSNIFKANIKIQNQIMLQDG